MNKVGKSWLIGSLIVIGIPVAYAFIMQYIFSISLWSELFAVMTVGFLMLLPFAMGALTIYFSKVENVRGYKYRVFMPWVPVLLFFILTLILAIEGWACWLMILPLFLLFSSLGGLVAGYYKLKSKSDKIYVSLFVFLPLLISPLEGLIEKIPSTYKAYTYIDIDASKEQIWKNVTRVGTISSKEDNGFVSPFLGLPRPIRAELNYEGVGATRLAIFDKGLVFHEKVIQYEHEKKMLFSIKAYPHEIPSTTMDKHIVIGGDYFDVLTGTYELEHLGNNFYRLHLYSYFKMNTTFNFYAGFWGKLIMKDIQDNILKVVKERAEKPTD